MNGESRPKAAPVTAAPDDTAFVTASGALTITWTIEAKAHVLQAARILELDPGRRYQARHLFGVASRLDGGA